MPSQDFKVSFGKLETRFDNLESKVDALGQKLEEYSRVFATQSAVDVLNNRISKLELTVYGDDSTGGLARKAQENMDSIKELRGVDRNLYWIIGLSLSAIGTTLGIITVAFINHISIK